MSGLGAKHATKERTMIAQIIHVMDDVDFPPSTRDMELLAKDVLHEHPDTRRVNTAHNINLE